MTNILFFYYDESDRNHLNVLKSVLQDHEFYTTNSLDKAQKLYKSKDYELVIVDFTLDIGKDFLSFIAEHNLTQKVITMSNNLECSSLKGCEYCMHTLNRKRVFKPLNLKELTHTIKNYETLICHYMHKFNNIVQILDDLIKAKYNHFVYEAKKQTIHPKDSFAQSLIVEELVHITELLQSNEIPYTVDEKYTIKLLT